MIQHTIKSARRELSCTDDGPVTSFELICRALNMASNPRGFSGCQRTHFCTEEIAAEALHAELIDRGYLNDDHTARTFLKCRDPDEYRDDVRPEAEAPDDVEELEAAAAILDKQTALPLLCSCGVGDCEPGYLMCPECIARDKED